MKEFILNLVGNDLWATLIMSFFPLIELKVGIMFARGIGYSFFQALGLSYLGSTLAFFPIFFLLIPVLKLLKKIKFVNKLALKIESYITDKSNSALKSDDVKKRRSESYIKMLSVFIFVAIPLPMTGVWMGTAIAVFLGMKFKEAVLPVVLGNLVAGIIISLLAQVCIALWTLEVLDYILYGLFALALVLLIVTIIKVCTKKTDKKEG